MITGVKGDPRVIQSSLEPWTDDQGRVRYYYDGWPRHLTQEQRDRYWSEHGTWLDGGPDIKVYFDPDGWLHIDGSPSRALADHLSKAIADWCRKERERCEGPCPQPAEGSNAMLRILIASFAVPFKQGFWKVTGGGIVVNLDDGQLAHYKSVGRASRDETGRYAVDTGYPRLDRALEAACAEKGDPAFRGEAIQTISFSHHNFIYFVYDYNIYVWEDVRRQDT